MATYQAPRGVITDLRFLLREFLAGPLIDQYNFTDGLDHDQWPLVSVYTGPAATGDNVTAQWVKDITADTITTASHKDPTGTSGVWRQSAGTYWLRVEPDVNLAYDVYFLRISFMPTPTRTWAEEFELELTVPGSIDPNAIVSVEDVTRGWTTTLDSAVIEGMIEDATDQVYGELEAGGIENPEEFFLGLGGVPRNVRRAIILLTRCMISTSDLSSGARPRSIGEGTEKITFATVKEGLSNDPCTEWMRLLTGWLRGNAPGRRPMLGNVTRPVGHTVNDIGPAWVGTDDWV